MLGVRLSHEIEVRLERLSQETGHTKSYYAKKAIEEFLDDRADYLLGISALSKKEPTISLEELEKRIEDMEKNK
jgi:RHH-type rel operon transcriptional repressor/antitoxin RelB